MWPFESKETRTIKRIVENAVKIAIERLQDKGLVSLYVAGSILTKDRVPNSDIDLIGLVNADFDFKEEGSINLFFEEKRVELFGSIETRFRAIPVSSFEGGEQKGIIKYFRPERFIKRMPFFKQVWGKKFNFEKDFQVKPMPLKEEALLLIENTEKSVKALRSGKEVFPFEDFPKHVMELIRVEVQKEFGFKFSPSYIKLEKCLRKEKHIVHKAMGLRNKTVTREEIVEFCKDVEIYLKYLKTKVEKWK